jgi:alginate O-acetyltransferase complex protein AlgJ
MGPLLWNNPFDPPAGQLWFKTVYLLSILGVVLKKFVIKSVLFLTPFIAIVLIELFMLPIDFSTFRAWEALKIGSLKWALPGYFYPNMTFTKVEEGDIGPYTPYAVKKRVEWQTDGYGYRTENTNVKKHSIVIIGDSYIAGSSLTQKELLSERLKALLNVSVYPLAPASINTFLKDKRFTDHPPEIVIFEDAEWDIPTLRLPKYELVSPSKYQKLLINTEFAIKSNTFLQVIMAPIDRILKGNLLHYSRAALRRKLSFYGKNTSVYNRNILSEDNSMLFLLGDKANADIPAAQFDKVVSTINAYHRFFTQRGIRFIFLPIPNKENIYYDLLPLKRKPVFLEQLIAVLKDSCIETIDTQRVFEEARSTQGAPLFHTDDTHWNVNGVRIVARLIAQSITQPTIQKKK